MRIFFLVFLIMCGPLFFACTPTVSAPVNEPPKVSLDENHADWGVERLNWSAATFLAIDAHGGALLTKKPGDWAKWCAKDWSQLSREDKAEFYVGLISSLARFESSFNPKATYKENFRDGHGDFVISRGLLQISKESANLYGCGIEKAEELHDPSTNLTCGVRILSRWVERDGVIQGGGTGAWRGAARYWSPFRKADRIAKMAAFTKGRKVCQ